MPLPAGVVGAIAAAGVAGFGGGVVGRIKRIEVFAVQLLLRDPEHLAKMINLSKPQFFA